MEAVSLRFIIDEKSPRHALLYTKHLAKNVLTFLVVKDEGLFGACSLPCLFTVLCSVTNPLEVHQSTDANVLKQHSAGK